MRYRMLTRNNEFSRAYARGVSFVCPCLVLYVNKNRCGRNRIGLTATKKVGNAVRRNRARRVMRAALDAVLPPSFCAQGTARSKGVDLVLVARGTTPKKKSQEIAAALTKLLQKAGVLCREDSATQLSTALAQTKDKPCPPSAAPRAPAPAARPCAQPPQSSTPADTSPAANGQKHALKRGKEPAL